MKRLIKLIVFLAVLAVAAVAVIYELFPDSAAAKFIDPYCRDYYFVARDWTLALVDRCRGEKGEPEPEESAAAEKPEPAAPSAKAPEKAKPAKKAAPTPSEPKPLSKAQRVTLPSPFSSRKTHSRRRIAARYLQKEMPKVWRKTREK